ncbi:hypothetical protein [Sphingobacterium spiritivorum]|uniref:hypothetical protein n=1 Tax=Sphingobacterium spiritivorum TaxID=258 RepID=UPI003DA3ABE9
MDINELKARIEAFNQRQQALLKSDEDLDKTILNPMRFQKAISLYETTENGQLMIDLIYSLGKYVWYNYYQNLHIPKDSAEDIENERIYKALEQSNLSLYCLIEKQVDWEIQKLKADGKNML